MKQDNYLFATGAVREAERRLIGPDDLKRMADAEDAEQSFKVLNDLSYADELLEVRQAGRFAEALAHDLGQTKVFINTMIYDRNLLKLLFAGDDFHNLRLAFRSKTRPGDPAGNFSDLGFLPAEKIGKFLLEDDRSVSLGRDYEAIVKTAEQTIGGDCPPRQIDVYFDHAYFAFMRDLARRLRDSRLESLVACQIDNANIKTVFRGHLLGLSAAEVSPGLVKGGRLSEAELAAYADLDENDALDKLQRSILDQAAAAELAELQGKFELWQLERVLDNRLLRLAGEVRMGAAGPASVYAYYLGKKNEIKNISLIMAAKLNNVGPVETNIRLRNLY